MTDPFSNPQNSFVSLPQLDGELVLVTPRVYLTGISTAFGDKDAVEADVAVIGANGAGEVHAKVRIFQGVIIGQVKGKIGQTVNGSPAMVLGRVGKGDSAKKGQQPPWVLKDPSEADKTAARAYLARLPKPKDPFS